jgi:hypothetical protein
MYYSDKEGSKKCIIFPTNDARLHWISYINEISACDTHLIWRGIVRIPECNISRILMNTMLLARIKNSRLSESIVQMSEFPFF